MADHFYFDDMACDYYYILPHLLKVTYSLLVMSMKALQESTDSLDSEACSVTPLVTEKLWVEKYAPNSFTELLSDEHTNREVNTVSNCTLLLQSQASIYT
jgi:hypothetical protein